MQYSIDPKVFEKYPGFMRSVVIAENIDNTGENAELAALLADAAGNTASLPDSFKELPQLAVWAEAFRGMRINPNKYPPSVTNLIKRARSGKPLPYVNTLVAAFNYISLTHLCPCGGDDLGVIRGDLFLGFSSGDEQYTPLGQPDVRETPPVGEIIYMDTGTRDVMCRAWCWKNGDRSKLGPGTTRAAVNIDIMPPYGPAQAETIAKELADLLERSTGATTGCFLLSEQTPSFVII